MVAMSKVVTLPAPNPAPQVEVSAVTGLLLDPAKVALTAAGQGRPVAEQVVATLARGQCSPRTPQRELWWTRGAMWL